MGEIKKIYDLFCVYTRSAIICNIYLQIQIRKSREERAQGGIRVQCIRKEETTYLQCQ